MVNNRSTWNRGTGYTEDSKFEADLRAGIFKDLEYHPQAIEYTINHKYYPDWVIGGEPFGIGTTVIGISKTIYIEAKGMFRESSELAKYVAVKKQLKPEEELVFLFQKPAAPIYFKAKRKDGTKLQHFEWAELHGFRWFTVETIKEIL